MEFRETRDRDALESYLRQQTSVQLYALADLDDFFFPETRWFAALERGAVQAICLLLGKLSLPIVYAVCPPEHPATRALLAWLLPQLPERFFLNLGLGLESVFASHELVSAGEHLKLALAAPERIADTEVGEVERLGPGQRAELEMFYRRDAYRGAESTARFLEPYMLERWPSFGIREHGQLVCVAGTHVLSQRYRVAAIGNVATRADCRGRGLARRATAALCRELLSQVDDLGMNVHVENEPALRCYRRLGFEPACRYLEGILTRQAA